VRRAESARNRAVSMLRTSIALVLVTTLGTSGCASWFHPKWTPQEKAVLAFSVQGVRLGSPPSHLKLFSQVKKDPTKREFMDVYEVYNPNSHISMMLAWYLKNHLKWVELRYFNSSGVSTLKISGGADGIRDFCIDRYGPPSRFGPDVPVVATQAGLDPKLAKFNGMWVFSRVDRQVNLITFEDASGAGSAFFSIRNTAAPTKKEIKQRGPFPKAEPPPAPSDPGPGFQ